MATLSTEDRQRVWRGAMRWWSKSQTVQPWLKIQLYNAVAATDNWIESNQASYVAALPQPFQGTSSEEQKTLLFCAVALARVGIAFLRALFGEVD